MAVVDNKHRIGKEWRNVWNGEGYESVLVPKIATSVYRLESVDMDKLNDNRLWISLGNGMYENLGKVIPDNKGKIIFVYNYE